MARMGPCTLSLITALLAVIAVNVVCGQLDKSDKSVDYDYFLLVRQWPTTFCLKQAARGQPCGDTPPDDGDYTLHGLWPERWDGTWPQCCCDRRQPSSCGCGDFEEREIRDLEDELEREWPSWKGHPGDDADFWGHQWNKHGTCATNVFDDAHAYFKAALKMHEALSVEDALEAANILPSDKKMYSAESIKAAIKKAHGVEPFIDCDGQGNLHEVKTCLNMDLEPVDCIPPVFPDGDSEQNRKKKKKLKDRCQMVTIPTVRSLEQPRRAVSMVTVRKA